MLSRLPLPTGGRKSKIRLMIFVNFKKVKIGQEAIRLAKVCREVEKTTAVKIIPITQTTDASEIAQLGIEVWSQAKVAAGVTGVLLNHSDNRLSMSEIKQKVGRFRINDLRFMICCESVEEGKQIAKFKPDYLVYEPPELIGGKIAVSTARPGIIGEFVREIKNIPVLVGAGIHSQADVRKAIDLGARGILVSHAVVAVDDPKRVLLDLAKGFVYAAI